MESWFGPRGTIVRWSGTAVIVAGVFTWLYSGGRYLVAALAMIGAGLLLRIEAAITTGLAERASCPDPSEHEAAGSEAG